MSLHPCLQLKQALNPVPEALHSTLQLLMSAAPAAGVERVLYFFSYGLVQFKLCNQLGTDKASKLVFLYKFLNP